MFANLPPLGLFQAQTLGGVYSAVSLILRSNDDCRARRVPRASGDATRSVGNWACDASPAPIDNFFDRGEGDKLALSRQELPRAREAHSTQEGCILKNAATLRRRAVRPALLALMLLCSAPLSVSAAPKAAGDDPAIAQSLAEMLRDARTVVSNNQDLINNPEIGDKGLTGKKILGEAEQRYKSETGVDPAKIDPQSHHGRLLRAMMDSIVEVVDANQETINAKGIGFKGFIPAVFGRLVSEAFARNAEGEAEIKVTAPVELVRNRKARPDSREASIIKAKLLAPDWPRGNPYSSMAEAKGRPAYRVMVPEYYAESCLTCHGSPKGEMDITGYPKEGGKAGDLGAVISITLYR